MTLLQTALTQQGAGDIALFLAPGPQLKNTTLATIEHQAGHDYQVIVIAVTLPYAIARRNLSQRSVDMSRIHFIDTLTKYSLGPHVAEEPQCIFLPNPSDITNLGIAITETLHRVPEGKRCVVLDDISTLLLYSPSGTVLKFMHFLITKLRLLEVEGLFFSVDHALAPQVISQMQTMMDKIVILESMDSAEPESLQAGA
ncbi:MAG: hypothetical protein ABFC24_00545 [Methanoregulaceae archaeon]